VHDVFDSQLSQTHTFVEKVYFNELQPDQKCLLLIFTSAVGIYNIMVNLIELLCFYNVW
jgi:hypothetical protein